MIKWARIISSALLLLLGILMVIPDFAHAINNPDSPPQISAIYVYEDCLEEGDVGVLMDCYLDYTTLPDETATDAYLAVFVDTDGATQLKSVAPYTFQNSGYGRFLIWMRFTASEVTSYGISSANEALYTIWLTGNPTLSWPGDPPKTTAGIDYWMPDGASAATLIALRVLYYADILELAWSLDLVEVTPLGNKLTDTGQGYFENVITSLRDIAPACFAAGTVVPELEALIYSTSFGAVATGVIVGSPVTLDEGTNTLTATSTGNITITLSQGTSGNITDGTGTVTSSPSSLVSGENIVTVTGIGTLSVVVNLIDTQSKITDTVEGTGFDLSTIANIFGLTRLMFSGLLWFVLSIIICASTYGATRRDDPYGTMAGSAGKMVMLVFAICLIGGTLLGLLDVRISGILVIAYSMFIGYVLFLRNAGGDIGKWVAFMGFVWFVVIIVGGVMIGSVSIASTELSADIDDDDTTIPVVATTGFTVPGTIVIGDERIAYYSTTNTTFDGTFWRHVVRGSGDTDAVAHSEGDAVRTVENSLLNNALNYSLAQLTDSSGIMLFISIPFALWNILTSFLFLPLEFLGTDMVWLTFLWGIVGLGLIVSIFVALAGGRRV